MAKTWPAFTKWNYNKNAHKELIKKLTGTNVTVYYDEDPNIDTENFDGYSFDSTTLQEMKFTKDFLPLMSEQPVGMTLRDSSALVTQKISEDILFPEFYHEFSELDHVELMMGQFFVEKTHYSKTDQFVCMVEGQASVRLVPHINRHELYAGESYYVVNGREKTKVEVAANESPINMFNVDFE